MACLGGEIGFDSGDHRLEVRRNGGFSLRMGAFEEIRSARLVLAD